MLVVKREMCVWLWSCYAFTIGDGVNAEMPVNGEKCAWVLFWSDFIIFYGSKGWGCGGFM